MSYEMERRPIQAAALPPGVNVTSHPRCGDADRQRASDRVNEAYARGFLDRGECDSRQDAISRATLAAHLELLVADIPSMARWSGRSVAAKPEGNRAQRAVRWWQDRQPWTGFAAIFSGVTTGVLPAVSVQTAGLTWLTPLVAGLTVPAGVVMFIGAIVSFMARYD